MIGNKEPDSQKYTNEDLDTYADILQGTNAIWRDYNPKTNKPKSSRSEKYREIIKPIYDALKSIKGSGTVFLPQDPNALVERLKLLKASRKAGHTGFRNEIVSILDELLRQKCISKEQYKLHSRF